jgi:MoaA/NifB/PqqE/SkfB family radical SAM enzyme
MDFFKKLINDLSDFDEQVDTLLIGGDVEPLTHPLFTEFIKIARSSNKIKHLKMSTNAYLLTHEMSRDIISSGMDIIQISVNGMNDEQYRELTSCDVQFKKIKENIEYLNSIKGNAHIHIKCIGDYFSDEQKGEFIEGFSPLCDTINIERLINLWTDMDLEIESGTNRFNVPNTEDSLICSRPFYAMNVHPNGNVNCCPGSIKTVLSLANASTMSLYDIWSGNKINELRMSFLHGDFKSKYDSCSKCRFTEFQSSEDLTPYRGNLLKKYR